MIKVILFDLDGTLLPMDQEVFVKAYFGGIAKHLVTYGYEPKQITATIWEGTKVMILNNGEQTNEQAFWGKFREVYGEKADTDKPYFDEFYQQSFDNVKLSCGYNSKAKEVIAKIKEKGFRVALATNPIFPAVATQKRIAWAGLSHNDFELYTTYENCRFCKPSVEYYVDIINELGVKAEECLMVGNDVTDDMVVTKLGMKCFLLTDNLINKNGVDISVYPNGNFDDLLNYIERRN